MFRIRIQNTIEKPCYLQIDPWASVYILHKGESIEIEVESDVDSPSFEMDECGDTKILTLPDCDKFSIIQGGKRFHWTDYQSNFPEHEQSPTAME